MIDFPLPVLEAFPRKECYNSVTGTGGDAVFSEARSRVKGRVREMLSVMGKKWGQGAVIPGKAPATEGK